MLQLDLNLIVNNFQAMSDLSKAKMINSTSI